MKLIYLICSVLCFIVISCMESGTLSNGKRYKCNCSRQELIESFDKLLSEENQYVLPSSYSKYDTWDENGYEFLHGRVIVLSNSQIVYFTLLKDKISDDMSTIPSGVSVRSVFDKKTKKWLKFSSLNNESEKVIEEKFEIVIRLLNEKYQTCSLIGVEER